MNPRMVRQFLESLERAGVTHVPAVAPRAEAATRSTPQPEATATTEMPAPSAPAQPVAETVAPPPEPAAPAVPSAAGTDRQARIEALQILSHQVAECTLCPELAATRRQTVFGVGDPEARILFIGEAPGADEDRIGEPFVGKAGQLLDKIISACQTRREEIYICNVLRCRPPGNRNPTPAEADNCHRFLSAQIEIVQPEYIVCWGLVAAKSVLGPQSSVGRLRGRFHQFKSAKVLVTYHPSYLLRNPSAKKQVWEDMKFLFADMGVEL